MGAGDEYQIDYTASTSKKLAKHLFKSMGLYDTVEVKVRFYYLDTNNGHECRKISSRETTEVKLKFYYLLELAIKTLTSKGIDPADVLEILPLDISSQFQSEEALTIDSIFKEDAALDKELRWYSFSLLNDIINELCDDECKLKLEVYVKTLKSYLQSRLLTLLPGCTCGREGEKLPCTWIRVDPEWTQKLVGSESDSSERYFIASLLNTTSRQIEFISCA